MTLEVAIQVAKAWARERCPACRIDALACPVCNPDPWPESRHTCVRDLEVVKDAMLAAVDSLEFLNFEGCGDCQDMAQFDARAKIRKLLGSEKGGGMREAGKQSRLIDLNEVAPGFEWAVFRVFELRPQAVFSTQAEALRWILHRREDWLYSAQKRAKEHTHDA